MDRSYARQYLPNYLLGETSRIISPPQVNFSLNESNYFNHDNNLSNKSPSTKTNQTIKFAPQTFSKKEDVSHKSILNGKGATKNKPPINSLRESIIYPQFHNDHSYCELSDPKDFNDYELELNSEESSDNSPLPDSEYTPTPEFSVFPSQDYWIRVFGIPVSQMKTILSEFAEFGRILSFKFASEGGNWMDMLYETRIDASQALRKNGNIFTGNVMVGVIPTPLLCITELKGENGVDQMGENLLLTRRNRAKLALKRSFAARQVVPDYYDAYIPLLSTFPGSSIISKILSYLF